MKKAVVTGGAGFIGSHVVDALVSRGMDVLVVDDLSSGRLENLARAGECDSGALEVEKIDICDRRLGDLLRAFRPEAVFHLAAQMNVRASVEDPAFDAEKNVVGTVNLLEAASNAGAGKIVFSSTGGAIYGEQEVFPASEEHPRRAECPYGVAKGAAELYLDYYARKRGMVSVSLRYANVYGPRQNSKGEAGVVAIFSDRIIDGETLIVNGDGKQTRDFVFVSDVVAANMLALERVDAPGFFTFNVGRGVESSVLEIVDGLKSAWSELAIEAKRAGGSRVAVEHGPALEGEQRRSVVDPSKIGRILGWQPTVGLLEGLRRTLESFIEARVR